MSGRSHQPRSGQQIKADHDKNATPRASRPSTNNKSRDVITIDSDDDDGNTRVRAQKRQASQHNPAATPAKRPRVSTGDIRLSPQSTVANTPRENLLKQIHHDEKKLQAERKRLEDDNQRLLSENTELKMSLSEARQQKLSAMKRCLDQTTNLQESIAKAQEKANVATKRYAEILVEYENETEKFHKQLADKDANLKGLADLKAKLLEANSDNAKKQSELDSNTAIKAEIARIQNESNISHQSLEESEKKLSSQLATNAQMVKENQEAVQGRQAAQDEASSLKAKLSILEKFIATQKRDLEKANENNSQLQARISLLDTQLGDAKNKNIEWKKYIERCYVSEHSPEFFDNALQTLERLHNQHDLRANLSDKFWRSWSESQSEE